MAARVQTMGCRVAPGPAHRPMVSLQASVDLVVWHFDKLYEGEVSEGLKQDPGTFAERLMAFLKFAPSAR
jgi:hypothetical protein